MPHAVEAMSDVESPVSGVTFLGPGDIALWDVSLRGDDTRMLRLREILSEEERQRASKFHFDRDRESFIVARGSLRLVLSQYLECAASDIRFVYSAFGKPSVHPSQVSRGLQFNLSHSGDLALIAVSAGEAVGIDIEQVDAAMEIENVGSFCFCPTERHIISRVPESMKAEWFFVYWTRKESYVKARGDGLSLPLKTIDVSEAPALLDKQWHVMDVATERGYKAALTSGSEVRKIHRYDTSDIM